VEYGFGKTMNLWSLNKFNRNLKSGLFPVAGYFLVSVFLSNIYSCLYKNETYNHFYCDPTLIVFLLVITFKYYIRNYKYTIWLYFSLSSSFNKISSSN
ncbi:hypothetical protein L873DRAFT_1674049, partial [Choiromyces venosus 120613-1]